MIKLVRGILHAITGRKITTDNQDLVVEKQFLKEHGWDSDDVESCGQSPKYLNEMNSEVGRRAIRKQRGED